MEKVFKVAFDCGFGIYQITGNTYKILTIHLEDKIFSINNQETLIKMKENSYPSYLIKCFEEFMEYFEGKLKSFESINQINFEGTEFQIKVWKKMLEIPFGKTISYSDLAILAGNPKACRSIGTICHKNPCEILIPCHRVVGKNSLGGFGHGPEIKKILLDFEKKYN